MDQFAIDYRSLLLCNKKEIGKGSFGAVFYREVLLVDVIVINKLISCCVIKYHHMHVMSLVELVTLILAGSVITVSRCYCY